jgi:hypothetical protein
MASLLLMVNLDLLLLCCNATWSERASVMDTPSPSAMIPGRARARSMSTSVMLTPTRGMR